MATGKAIKEHMEPTYYEILKVSICCQAPVFWESGGPACTGACCVRRPGGDCEESSCARCLHQAV